MAFNTIPFFIYYACVLLLFYNIKGNLRWLILLVSGLIFYLNFIPSYVVIILTLIFVDYNIALLLEKTKTQKPRLLLLLTSLSLNIGLLIAFKYFNFLNDNLEKLAGLIGWNYSIESLNLIIPLGLSFHTFQSISYLLDVYKKKWPPEKNLLKYSLFVLFFPQLMAGPIEKASQLLPQFYTKYYPGIEDLKIGFQRILLGIFKKVIIADHLAVIVDIVYRNPYDYIGLPLVIATIAFAFQIYCDFSGYTDIAIGLARTFGIRLEENFKFPYLSSSISTFWRRWHITLYNWFRDYIYFPLGGNRLSQTRTYLNISIVFLLSGLWHGASWTFIFWGLLHALYLITENLLSKIKLYRLKLPSVIRILITFFFVCVAWIFFRAGTISEAIYILTNSHKGLGSLVNNLIQGDLIAASIYTFSQGSGLGVSNWEILILCLTSLGLLFFEGKLLPDKFYNYPRTIRWTINLIMVVAIINFSIGTNEPFIYFQF